MAGGGLHSAQVTVGSQGTKITQLALPKYTNMYYKPIYIYLLIHFILFINYLLIICLFFDSLSIYPSIHPYIYLFVFVCATSCLSICPCGSLHTLCYGWGVWKRVHHIPCLTNSPCCPGRAIPKGVSEECWSVQTFSRVYNAT